ncbi:MAG: hypothetical protein JWL83_1457 [Actinomycetia bacterium]|nr:hypothetical protein [Actinomycetes bacterium]
MAGIFVLLAIAFGAIVLWKRASRERRDAIDIAAVIDAKYPNRARRDDPWLQREGDGIGDLSLLEDEAEIDLGLHEEDLQLVVSGTSTRADVRNMAISGTAARSTIANASAPGIAPPIAAPIAPRVRTGARVLQSAPGTDTYTEPSVVTSAPFMVTGFPPPLLGTDARTPIPGEPDDLTLLGAAPPQRAGTPSPVDISGVDPYVSLKVRRDRVATQAADAFQEVHRLRTEALRRASQAEHNAALATSARGRAGRMVRDTRRVEAQGRRRPSEMPNSDDAYGDVHRFRTEALKRAQQAEHGAQKVSQARERANRLLVEQRQIEAEMAKLTRLRNAAAAR